MQKEIYNIMPPISDILVGFLDTLTGHLALLAYLLAVMDEWAVWKQLKKLSPLLLYKLRFGKWFRLLLDNEPAPWRTAFLLLALEVVTELFLCLVNGVQPQYLLSYYLLDAVMVVLMTALVVYLAQRFDAARKMQAQNDCFDGTPCVLQHKGY